MPDLTARIQNEFNIEEFLALASRVVDSGDVASLAALTDLKTRWVQKFGVPLKPVTAHELTPFRPPLCQARRIPRLPTPKQERDILSRVIAPNPPVTVIHGVGETPFVPVHPLPLVVHASRSMALPPRVSTEETLAMHTSPVPRPSPAPLSLTPPSRVLAEETLAMHTSPAPLTSSPAAVAPSPVSEPVPHHTVARLIPTCRPDRRLYR
ncbi:UNVERIFIED_CONTAM: hypothetical protein Slati_4451400 [Sesamum latifolium]|uniref:Uncharacterized protein n=1 Tax=Sesamum latifolium TaxID=2727402 RepID=A0AAW2SRT7_9LAMI